MSNRGWKAAFNQPYYPIGEFPNVLSAYEGVKGNLPHVNSAQDQETSKNLKTLRRLFATDNPDHNKSINNEDS